MAGMPWWSWVVIWVVLVLALLGMLTLFGFRLFRKLTAALDELGKLADKTDLLHQRSEELREERFQPAVFADASALRAARDQDLADRERRRQARRDSLVKRGKLLVRADPQQFSHLTRRT
jgi:flagellar biosynthesis/type III secretory pathway M-ring protein FliF/YscJ